MIDGLKRTPTDDLTSALDEAAVRRASFERLEEVNIPEPGRPSNDIAMVMDLPVQVMVELGRTSMSIGGLLSLHEGAVIELNVSAGDPLDLLVNGCLVAQGEVVIVNEHYGIRLTDIVSPSERLHKSRR